MGHRIEVKNTSHNARFALRGGQNAANLSVKRNFFAPNFVDAPRHPWCGKFIG